MIYIEAEFDHDDVVGIYFSSQEKAGFREKFKKNSELFTKNVKSRKQILLSNHVARKLRIDTGSKPGTIKLYSVRLINYFGPGTVFNYRQIHKNFLPNELITTFSLEEDHVLIEANGLDSFLTLKGELVQKNFFLETILPLIFAFVGFLICRYFSLRSIHAFNDIEVKKSSSGINIGSLDGIRGLAALLVLGQHTG